MPPTRSYFVDRVLGRLSLRTVLIVPFVLQIVGTVGLVGYLSFKSGQDAVQNLVYQLMTETGDRVTQKLDNYLQAAHQINQSHIATLKSSGISLKNLDQLHQYLIVQLQHYPEVTSLMLGTQQGDFRVIHRVSSSEVNAGLTQIKPTDLPFEAGRSDTDNPSRLNLYAINKEGHLIRYLESIKNLDVRERPWYIDGVKTEKSGWSEPFQIGASNLLTINAYTPFYDVNHHLQGIFSVNLSLERLNAFLKTLSVSQQGQVFIIERNGLLIANSAGEPSYTSFNLPSTSPPSTPPTTQPGTIQFHRQVALDSRNLVMRSATQQLQKTFGSLKTLQSHHNLAMNVAENSPRQTRSKPYFLSVIPYHDNYGLDWLIVTVVPESDFMGQIHANIRTTILVCLVALVGSITVGILTTRWIIHPILNLNSAAKQFAQRGWEKPLETTRSDEIGELVKSFNQMSDQLQHAFSELQSLNQALFENESRLNQILEAIPVGVSFHDTTGQIIYTNYQSRKLLGIETLPQAKTEQLAIAYRVYLTGTDQLYPVDKMPIVRSLKGERARVDDMEIRLPDHTVPLEVYSTPLFDERGEVVAAIAAFFDIRKQKKAQSILADYNRSLEAKVAEHTAELAKANEQLKLKISERTQIEQELRKQKQLRETIYNESTDAIFLVDARTRLITDCNRRAVELFEFTTKEELIGLQGRTLQRYPYSSEEIDQISKEMYQKGFWSREIEYVTRNGRIFWGNIAGKPVLISGAAFTLVRITDITDRKLAEVALQESETRLKLALEATQTICWERDLTTDYIIFSGTLTDPSTPLELPYAQALTWIHPDDRDELDQKNKAAIASLGSFEMEHRMIRDHNSWGWVLVRAKVLTDSTGKPHRVIGVSVDINDRKQAESEIRELATALENAVEGISRLDTQGRYLSVNKAYARLTGYQPEEMIGRDWQFTVHPHEYKTMTAAYQEMLEVGKVEAETQGVRKDGSTFYKQVVMITAYDEQQTFVGHYCFMKDISDRKQAELALQEAKDTAEAANRAKSQFLANMSHELRTPLNGILGYAQILERDENCTSKQKEDLRIISQCGTHLLTLINDILDLAKIEAEKMELYPSDIYLSSFLEELSHLFQLKAIQKNITFLFCPVNTLPLVIKADAKRLRQVLMNLLSNAIKFTDRGGVTFKVTLVDYLVTEETSTATLHFEIVDTGIGINPDQWQTIFLPFEQVGDSSRQSEGTGLGLAISQQIVHLMGGQIWMESTPQVGSRFGFEVAVPVLSTALHCESLPSTDRIIGYEGRKRKILIVEDHPANRTILVNLLEPIGFELIEAVNGQEGLAKALEVQPDLIITDLMMPVMNGFEMTQRLRQLPEFEQTIVLATSASVFEIDQQKSHQSGCQDFLPKPINVEELFHKIEIYLNLTWVYNDRDPDQSQKTGDPSRHFSALTLAEMVIPSKHDLMALYVAADSGQVEGVEREVKRLQALNPDYGAFMQRVRDFAENFDYEEIVSLIDACLSGSLV